MIKQASLLILILSIFISCQQPQKQEGLSVSGQFLNAAGKTIYFSELNPDGAKKLDSIILNDKGEFHFSSKPTDAGFYLIKSSTKENILLLLGKNETVSLSADFAKTPFDYQVSGSPGSQLLKDFYSKTFVNLAKADSLAAILAKMQGSPDYYKMTVTYDPLFLKLINDQKTMELDFIKKNDTSLASIIVLNYKFGVLPVLKIEDDFAWFTHLDSTLSKSYPNNKHLLGLHQTIIDYKKFQDAQKVK